jgi:multidrug resistance protein MdtO
MAALPDTQPQRGSLLEFLSGELAPREGRTLAVVHMATACTITVAIAMVFRIPEPTYMAYIVFLISKDERAATVTTGLGGQIAVTLAIFLMLGSMMIDLSEPALRLPGMALATFVAMYTVRTFVLGPITYLAGFVLVMLQSVVDDVPSPEALTHITLWMWVVLAVPIVITLSLNPVFAPGARLLSERTRRKVLSELEQALLRGEVRRQLSQWQETTVALLAKNIGPAESAVIRRLVDVLITLEVLPDEIPSAQREDLAARVRACRNASVGGPTENHAPSGSDDPNILALVQALETLEREIAQPGAIQPPAAPHAKRPVFVPDAFTNSAHWQFAAKTTFAVMVVYAVYTLLDWPGMRTSIVTCFFVALGSLGETMHKLVLRISGALLGGLIAGLCIVFVLPHMTDIGQLSVLIFLVSAGAAWVATSSERLSYAGLQTAFAFFLGILQDYAPANDLTVLRDRVAGIVLGNIVMAVIFSVLWPESARDRLRETTADTLRKIGALLKREGDPEAARTAVAQALVKADHYGTLSSFELNMLTARPRSTAEDHVLTDTRRVAGTAFVATAAQSDDQSRLAQQAAEKLLLEIQHAAPP